jgi:hypothetical protein
LRGNIRLGAIGVSPADTTRCSSVGGRVTWNVQAELCAIQTLILLVQISER